jgi:hypothetical protein
MLPAGHRFANDSTDQRTDDEAGHHVSNTTVNLRSNTRRGIAQASRGRLVAPPYAATDDHAHQHADSGPWPGVSVSHQHRVDGCRGNDGLATVQTERQAVGVVPGDKPVQPALPRDVDPDGVARV